MENQPVGAVPTPPAQASKSLTPEQAAFVKRGSFGAFSLGIIYFLASGLMIDALLTLVPFVNLYIWIRGIISGRKMSWEKATWTDFTTYQKRQKLLDKIGIVVLIVSFVFGVIMGVISALAVKTSINAIPY